MMIMASEKSKHSDANLAAVRNAKLEGLKCLRCEQFYDLDDKRIDSGFGCVKCLQEGFPVGLRCLYAANTSLFIDHKQTGMHRFANNLPYANFPTLGEGNTALVPIEKFAIDAGVLSVAVKNEGQNPTGSHKDRMSPLAVARAMAMGYSKVIASSSGNAGASLAAYAARSGLSCCIIASDISAPWAEAIQLAGSQLRIVESKERWPLMQRLVQEDGWFPVTNFYAQPIASNPFGIEGYKTVAYEIIEQSGEAMPDFVIVPTCRGDLLFGLYRGFAEAVEAGLASRLPRLIAVEPGKRLEQVLSGSDYRSAFKIDTNNMASIDGGTATYQSMKALQATKGLAVSVNSDDAASAQVEFARNGFHVEMSSAASLAALRKLKVMGRLQPKDRIVLIATSHGYKETSASPLPTASRSCN